MNKKKIIVTTALPYVNNTPHLGNLIGSLLSADVFTRYKKRVAKIDEEVLFVGGVDEYGTATEVKAKELNISCKELCDVNGKLHKEVYDWFLIKFDCYGQTSQPNGNPAIVQHDWPQTKITHEIFQELCKNGYVIEQTEKVMYCPATNSFVADRFVIGTCPKCGSSKADGDQCDLCGTLFAAGELLNPKYKPNPEYNLEIKETTNLYIDTNKIWQDKHMTEWFESRTNWTKTASDITSDWLKMGLLLRSITRDLVWGTAVPDTPDYGSKFASKVFYVWFDAPIGYISITENAIGKERSESFWRSPDTKLIQFMAKDNVPFHAIIFPVTLQGSGYSNMTDIDIASTNYLMYEGNKFSKSNNVGLFCDDVMNLSKRLDIPPDYWRAYLVFIRPEAAESNFVLNGEGGFVEFVNNILLKNFGNLVHRVLSTVYQIGLKHDLKKFSAIIPKFRLSESDDDIKSNINIDVELNADIDVDSNADIEQHVDKFVNCFKNCYEMVEEYINNMNSYKLCGALRIALKYSTEINRSFQAIAPWTLMNIDDKKTELYEFMGLVYKHINILLNLLEPFMPSIVEIVRYQLIFTETDIDDINKVMIEVTPLKKKPLIIIKPIEKIIV